MDLSVVADASELKTVTTDLGYEVEVTEAQMVVDKITFAIAGELLSQGLLKQISAWVVPNAHAHSGHYEGGDITGELSERLLIDWIPGAATELGVATLLEGSYKSANLSLGRWSKAEDPDDDEDRVGCTALLWGIARRDDEMLEFHALIAVPEDSIVTGVPFEFVVESGIPVALYLELRTFDEIEGDTLFDGIDFAELDLDDDGVARIVPGAASKPTMDAHLSLSQALQTHDNYRFTPK